MRWYNLQSVTFCDELSFFVWVQDPMCFTCFESFHSQVKLTTCFMFPLQIHVSKWRCNIEFTFHQSTFAQDIIPNFPVATIFFSPPSQEKFVVKTHRGVASISMGLWLLLQMWSFQYGSFRATTNQRGECGLDGFNAPGILDDHGRPITPSMAKQPNDCIHNHSLTH